MAKPRERLDGENTLYFNGCALTKEADGSLYIKQKGQGRKITLVATDLMATKDRIATQQYVEQRARGAYIATIC